MYMHIKFEKQYLKYPTLPGLQKYAIYFTVFP